MDEDKRARKGVDHLLMLQINLAVIFTVLKLTGTITWSWLWVLSPLWIGLACWLFIGVLFLFFCIIVMIINEGIENI